MKRPGPSADKLIIAADSAGIVRAAAIIAAGGVVAIPTETSYGLAVDPENSTALDRLFRVKQRPEQKPVLLLIDRFVLLKRLATRIPACYPPLLRRFWPGPLTLLFPAQDRLDRLLTGGTGTIGIRMSSERIVAEICRHFGGPITGTSANLSDREPACSAQAVVDQLGRSIDLVVDGGERTTGPGSTIIGESHAGIRLVRPGRIDFAALLAVLEMNTAG